METCMLGVQVGRACNLKLQNDDSYPSLYVVLTFDRQQFRTTIKEKDRNPVWNEHFQFNVLDPSNPTKLEASLHHDEKSHQNCDCFIGMVSIDVTPRVPFADAVSECYFLNWGASIRKRGDLHLKLYIPDKASTSASEPRLGVVYKVPFSLEDPDYKGLELDRVVWCGKHGKPSERLVAFEGTYIGGRFLACREPEGHNCGFVEWVDQQWPPTMENALLKLWSMVEESKTARVEDNLLSAFKIHNLTEEKNKMGANYDKLVKDVHQLVDMHNDRVVDFSYLQSNLTYQQQCITELVADMKAEMANKDAGTQKLNQKYELLRNLTSAQATVIQNLKLKNMKEKELLSEAGMNLELKNAEFTKFEEKLTQEKLELKFQVADLLKGKDKHDEEKYMLQLQIVELKKGEEKLKEKIKGIQAILQN